MKLSVPLKKQPSGSNLCWAMCAVMVCDYFNGPFLTAEHVLKHFQFESDTRGCAAMAAAFLESEYRLSYKDACKDAGINPVRLLQYINRKVPVILGFTTKTGGHAVVLVGYHISPEGKITFLVNDPEEDATRTVVDLSSYEGMKLTEAYAIGENRF